jgi:tRNA A37 threonylcarbamoyltransferase TsaD
MTVVLGIETSCDETSAAVLEQTESGTVLKSLVILSQDVHRVFGGVVPEIASRAVKRKRLSTRSISLRSRTHLALLGHSWLE